MRSTRQLARVAGFLYLLTALIAPIGLLYVPGKLIVALIAVSVTALFSVILSVRGLWNQRARWLPRASVGIASPSAFC
jgi:hypothetical protein